MFLLMKGQGEQPWNWKVDEPVSAGYARIYFLEKGVILYRERDREQVLQPGHLYVFSPSISYSMRHAPDDVFPCTWLHADFFPAVLTRLLDIPLKEDAAVARFGALLRELICEGEMDAPCTEMAAQAFLSYLQQRYLPSGYAPLENVIRYIRQNFRSSELSVSRISENFGYTPEHFIRLFSRNMGMTPYRYLTNLRLYEACRLLMENHTVNDTAQSVGYEDARSFSHAFQKRYGVSPWEYRFRHVNAEAGFPKEI